MTTIVNWIEEGNPQLVRELKGRLKPRNVASTVTLSLLSQFLLYLYFGSLLPTAQSYQSRYCTGDNLSDGKEFSFNYECILDLRNHVMLLKELWWLDLFVAISIASIVILLGVGTALLIADLAREKNQGTLNFIRLSPRSPESILIGKILGVPILLYIALTLVIPLHFRAGLAAGIPASLILGFYGVLAASCACFYSLAVVVGLMGGKEVQALWASLATLLSLFLTALAVSWLSSGYVMDWLKLCNPVTSLPYLVQSTFLPHQTVGYLNAQKLASGLWYGQPLWLQPQSVMSFMGVNYAVWTYWFWQAGKRRFCNPTATIWSKQHSYWLSAFFTVFILGFALQSADSAQLSINFRYLLLFNAGFLLLLIAALSPHRQTLLDWTRDRYQNRRSLALDLLWGEKSPAPVAIALNFAIVIGFSLPSVLLFPVANKTAVVVSLFLNGSLMILYAIVTQLMLMREDRKRVMWATATIGAMVLVPMYLDLTATAPHHWLWLFTLQPLGATELVQTTTIVSVLLVQWLAIIVLGVQMTRQLRRFGQSQTKVLPHQVRLTPSSR